MGIFDCERHLLFLTPVYYNFPPHPISHAKPDNPSLYRNKHLVLSGGSLWELEVDTTAGKAAVDLGVSIESVVDTSLLLLVKDDLEDLGAVLLGAETLANNLDWEDEIGEDGVVDSSQGAGTWALLGEGSAGAGRALWAWQDAAGSEDQDVTVGELLLELAGKTNGTNQSIDLLVFRNMKVCLPLLHLVETGKGWDGDKDDNSLLAVANLNLRDQSQRAISF